ncbi:DUF6894 family protein [Sphingomonas sp. IC4-52]|uniref:DUF6894 family protein n=1 Tax=Sphingomonas sp. IC4-52 TaxID=2887202 RepID=UPI001D116AC6|nr:hypothetical protein [Sphingomonas sp. IC4-52]MCC2979531.1 hypothetical protein [Sphingomonas sp. IC4-52]
MARYFFHLRDHDSTLLDEEGVELADLAVVRQKALDAARDTLSHDIRAGFIDLRFRIDVATEDGAVVHSLALEDAFVVRGRD